MKKLIILLVLLGLSGVGLALGGDDVWTTHGPAQNSSQCIVIHPTNPLVLFAGTDSGDIFRSDDGGDSWQPACASFTSVPIFCLLIDPANPASMFAGINGNGVYKSTDSGVTWKPANTGIGLNVTVRALAMDPANSSFLYAATSNKGIFKSTNAGGSWTATNEGLTETMFYSLIIHPTDHATLYAGGFSGGVFRSTDRGGSWSRINPGLTSFPVVYSIAIPPANPAVLYVGTSNGMYKSTDGGESWMEMNTGLTNQAVDTVALYPSGSSRLFVGTWGGGVFSSTDGGGSWTAMNQGLANKTVLALALDDADPSTLHAAVSSLTNGVYSFTFTCEVPVIEASPAGQAVCAGQAATLAVQASGKPGLHYAWYQGLAGNTSEPAPGAEDSAQYTTPALSSTTRYWVRVTTSCGTADSSSALVTVYPAPSFAAQPQGQAVLEGHSAVLTVSAKGTLPVQYAWYRGASGDTGIPAPGTNNRQTYTTPALSADASYWCRLTGVCGEADSAAAMITVLPLAFDLNGDGKPDGQDSLLLAEYLASVIEELPCGPNCGDCNQDGQVDLLDFIEMMRRLGQ